MSNRILHRCICRATNLCCSLHEQGASTHSCRVGHSMCTPLHSWPAFPANAMSCRAKYCVIGIIKATLCESSPAHAVQAQALQLLCCPGLLLMQPCACRSVNFHSSVHRPVSFSPALQDLTPEYFAKEYEAPRKPVVITGATDKWPAQQQWTPKALLEQYKDHKFKVCAATETVTVPLHTYQRYSNVLSICVNSKYRCRLVADSTRLAAETAVTLTSNSCTAGSNIQCT